MVDDSFRNECATAANADTRGAESTSSGAAQ